MENIDNKRRQYKKSFLKNIQSMYSYSPIDLSEEAKDKVTTLLTGKGFTITDSGKMSVIQARKDGAIMMILDKGITLSVDIADYPSFDDYKVKYLSLIRELSDVMGVACFTNFVFQKVNYYKLTKNLSEKTIDKERVYKMLFSDRLLNNLPIYAEINPPCYYTAQPSFKENEESSVAQLLISVIYAKEIKVVDLIDEMSKINDHLFSLWYDSTTDRIRSIMDK